MSDRPLLLPAIEIFGRPSTPVLRPATAKTLAAAIAILPALDDGTAGLVEDLACAIIDREDELRGVHAVLTAALALTHMQYVEIVRLKARVASLLDARRQPQRPAA
jgi:hypothetical protein